MGMPIFMALVKIIFIKSGTVFVLPNGLLSKTGVLEDDVLEVELPRPVVELPRPVVCAKIIRGVKEKEVIISNFSKFFLMKFM
jgi:hypothetical protein